MKPNELVLTIVQLAAPITAFAIGVPVMGWFLIAWILFFAAVELIAKAKTGKTLSQHVWTRPMWQRALLSAVMIAGMVALGFHFLWG